MCNTAKAENGSHRENEGFVRREAYLVEREKSVRQTASKGLRANRFTAPFVNAYAALLVFLFLDQCRSSSVDRLERLCGNL